MTNRKGNGNGNGAGKGDRQKTMNLEHTLSGLLEIAQEHNLLLEAMSTRSEFKRVTLAKNDKYNDLQIKGDLDSGTVLEGKLHSLAGMGSVPVNTEETLGKGSKFRDYGEWLHDGSEMFFLIDPIDGSAHFQLESGMSRDWGYTICLVKGGIPILGVVSLPAYGEIYYTAENSESFMLVGGKASRLAFGQPDPNKTPIVYSESTGKRNLRAKHVPINEVFNRNTDLRNTGCTVANFRQMFIVLADAVGSAGHPWDWMAASMIVAHAGGGSCEFSGKPLSMTTTMGCLSANSPKTLSLLLKMLEKDDLKRSIQSPNVTAREYSGRVVLTRTGGDMDGFAAAVKEAREAWPLATEFYGLGDFSAQESDDLYLNEGVICTKELSGMPNYSENFEPFLSYGNAALGEACQ